MKVIIDNKIRKSSNYKKYYMLFIKLQNILILIILKNLINFKNNIPDNQLIVII